MLTGYLPLHSDMDLKLKNTSKETELLSTGIQTHYLISLHSMFITK